MNRWLLGESEIALQLFFGYVLRARLLILQFSKTAFFLKRVASERKKEIRISVFSLCLYIPLNDKVLCVLLGGRQALTRQIIIGGSVGNWVKTKP